MVLPDKRYQIYTIEKRKVNNYTYISCRFINENKNIVFMEKPGVGKTHLANAIELETLKQGYKVLFLHINDLIEKLNNARADGSIRKLMNTPVAVDLLILDEFGFKKYP